MAVPWYVHWFFHFCSLDPGTIEMQCEYDDLPSVSLVLYCGILVFLDSNKGLLLILGSRRHSLGLWLGCWTLQWKYEAWRTSELIEEALCCSIIKVHLICLVCRCAMMEGHSLLWWPCITSYLKESCSHAPKLVDKIFPNLTKMSFLPFSYRLPVARNWLRYRSIKNRSVLHTHLWTGLLPLGHPLHQSEE